MPRDVPSNDDDFLDAAPHMSAGQLQMMAEGASSRMQIEGEAADEAPMEVWQTEPMHDCDFSNEDESPCDDPSWCFICYVKENENGALGSQNYHKLLNFIEESKSRMSPRALVHQTQHFYNSNLRSRVNGQKFWTRRMIWEVSPSHRIVPQDDKLPTSIRDRDISSSFLHYACTLCSNANT